MIGPAERVETQGKRSGLFRRVDEVGLHLTRGMHIQADNQMGDAKKCRPYSDVAPPIGRDRAGLTAQDFEDSQQERHAEKQHAGVGRGHAQTERKVFGPSQSKDQQKTDGAGQRERQVVAEQALSKGLS